MDERDDAPCPFVPPPWWNTREQAKASPNVECWACSRPKREHQEVRRG